MPDSNVRRINGVEITGTPNAGDVPVAADADSAVWASPGGGGLLTGAVILNPTTSIRNKIVEGDASVPHLILRASGLYSPVTNMQEWQDSSGQYVARVNYPGFEPVMEVRADLAGANILGFKSTANGVDPAILGTNDGSGAGVKGTNTGTGPAVHGSGTSGISGLFQSANAANTEPTLVARQIGAGTENLQEWQSSASATLSYIDYLGAFHGGVVLTQQVVVLSTSGSATNYATLALAKAAASSGDTIAVYPGTYDEKNLLKNGVNWFFFPGAKVIYTGSGDGGIFDDTAAYGAAGTVICTIGGHGYFKRAGAGASPFAFNITNSGSEVDVQCSSIISNGDIVIYQTNGKLRINVDVISGTTGHVENTAGTQIITARFINIISGDVRLTGSGTQYVSVMDASVRRFQVESTGTQVVQVQHASGNTSGGTNRLFGITGAGRQVVTCGHAETAGTPTLIAYASAGTQDLTIGYATASDSLISCAGGTQRISILDGTQSSTAATILVSSGTCHLKGRYVASNSAAHGISKSGGTCIVDNATIISGASGKSLYAAAAQDVTIYGTCTSNTDKDANVTVRVGTFTYDNTYVT